MLIETVDVIGSEESESETESSDSMQDFMDHDEQPKTQTSKTAANMSRAELEVLLKRKLNDTEVGKARFEASLVQLEQRYGCSQ